MSSQEETVASDSLKSRSLDRNILRSAFTFEHTGSLKDRLLTALIVITVACVLSVLAVKLPYGGLLGVAWTGAVAVLSAFEVVRLFARDRETLHYKPVVGALAFVILVLPSCAAIYLALQGVVGQPLSWTLVYGALLLSAQGMMVYHVITGRKDLDDAARQGGRYGPAFLLIAIGAPQLIILSGFPHGIQLLWWLVAVVALNDAGAYFVGRAFGRTKMAPALSPNKTIEGSVAGLLIGALAGVVFWRLLLGADVSTPKLLLLSLCATCAAQAADLSKSYLKRLRGVKDTGSFFPGHGGILDRFDGMIGAAPIVVVALMLWGACRAL